MSGGFLIKLSGLAGLDGTSERERERERGSCLLGSQVGTEVGPVVASHFFVPNRNVEAAADTEDTQMITNQRA